MSPIKEPSYFLFEGGNLDFRFVEDIMTQAYQNIVKQETPPSLKDYLSLFEQQEREIAIGEASPDYIHQHNSPTLIHNTVPDAKIIAILRNPFDATYSDFLMKQRDGVWCPNLRFLDVLKSEKLGENNLWVYPNLIRIRFYDIGLKRYFKKFPTNQIKIFLLEDLQNSKKLLNDCFKFLGVSGDFEADLSIKYNTTDSLSFTQTLSAITQKVPSSIKIKLKKITPQTVLKWYSSKRLGLSKVPQQATTKCPPIEKEFLKPIFTPHILRLQDLINRDLSDWLD